MIAVRLEIGADPDTRTHLINAPAFGRRCILPGCVAPLSHTPGMLGRRALPARRLAALGASPHL